MIPALCTLVLLALSGALLLRAGGRMAQTGRVVAGIDADRPARLAGTVDAAREEAAAALRDRRAGRGGRPPGDR